MYRRLVSALYGVIGDLDSLLSAKSSLQDLARRALDVDIT